MDTNPIITCFDLATKTGVATGRACGKPVLETWDLSGPETRPEKLNRFDGYLERHFDGGRIQRVFYEAPLPIAVLMDIGAREETIQMLRSLAAMVEACAARHGLPVATWAVQKARRGVIGQGRFARGEAKRAVMRHCRWLKANKIIDCIPKDDNQADALIGFLYESSFLNPRMAHLSTPLFATSR